MLFFRSALNCHVTAILISKPCKVSPKPYHPVIIERSAFKQQNFDDFFCLGHQNGRFVICLWRLQCVKTKNSCIYTSSEVCHVQSLQKVTVGFIFFVLRGRLYSNKFLLHSNISIVEYRVRTTDISSIFCPIKAKFSFNKLCQEN